ncbi:MAG TPA: SoxR reducing system RseC family protein [Clostridiales bacterium]|nr:SoxR reducing system RseC family protein [Clostridiales bacterium]
MDRGTVTRTEEGFAYIEMELNESCHACANKGACMAGDKPVELKIEDSSGLKPGDMVEIDLPPQTKLTAGFLLFIFPIISLIICYYIALRIWGTEDAGMIGALTGLVLGIVDLIIFNKIAAKKRYFKPRSVRKMTR